MSKRALLIAEKPSLMRAIRDAVNVHGFDDDIVYKAFAGHTMSLKMPNDYTEKWERMNTTIADLPMIPAPFEYQPTQDKVSLYNDLKAEVESGKYDYVINACDAGREGQHIFWSFYETIGSPLPVKRLWSGDTTTDGLGHAMNNLRDPSEPRLLNMTEASKLRAQFDWLIGMNASRAFSEKARAGIAVGRVMSPTLKLVVDRELEIRNFKAKDFFEVEANFDGYIGKYTNPETKGRFRTKKEAEDFIRGLNSHGLVKSINRKKQTTRAPELFSLQTLQSEAGKRFGYTMTETLQIVQSLYDDGFMSYPRTDSSYVTKNTASTFPTLLKTVSNWNKLEKVANKIISDTSSITTIQNDKRYVDDRKVEDHDAILPTKMVPNRKLSKDEENIYDLVSRRFLAIFLPPLIVEKTRIVTDVDGDLFNTNGNIMIQLGFSELYGYKPNDQDLPDVKKGEKRNITETNLLVGKTTPPKRYNSSSLGDAMAAAGRFTDNKSMREILRESKGIGTPATRGNIVEKLVERKWMEYKGKAKTIHATNNGINVIELMGDHEILSVELTAEWEEKLGKIESNEMSPLDFEKDMKKYINEVITGIDKMKIEKMEVERKPGSVGSIVGDCPSCGGDVIIGNKVYFCKNYDPDNQETSCNFIVGRKIAKANLSLTELKKIMNNKPTKELNMTSKKGSKFKAKVVWNESKKQTEFVFSDSGPKDKLTGETGVKMSSGEVINADKYNWLYDGMRINKEIWGVEITPKQAKQLFSGEKIGPFLFTWKSGKSSKAKIYYNKQENRINYDFS